MSLKERHIEQNKKQIKKVLFGKTGAKDEFPRYINCETKKTFVADVNPDALFADGFDDAIIGYDASGFCVVYDYNKCLDVLVKRDKMSMSEAHEYMEFNVVGAFVGDFTPHFVHTLVTIG
jgi:hypothetical protein